MDREFQLLAQTENKLDSFEHCQLGDNDIPELLRGILSGITALTRMMYNAEEHEHTNNHRCVNGDTYFYCRESCTACMGFQYVRPCYKEHPRD